LRESDIKKLGVVNSKDRSRMMNSLATFKGSLGPVVTREWHAVLFLFNFLLVPMESLPFKLCSLVWRCVDC